MSRAPASRSASPPDLAGYVLLPVALGLALIAAIAFVLGRQGAAGLDLQQAGLETAEGEQVLRAALEHATWTAARSGCTGYALSDTPFGSHGYSASFTPSAGSPVVVTASATLVGGAMRSRARSIAVHEAPSVTVLQPGMADVEDTFLSQTSPTSTYDDSNFLRVTAGAPNEVRSLLRFDLSQIPAGSRVLQATLELTLDKSGGASVPIEVRAVRDAWSGSGASWQERDAGQPWGTPGGDLELDGVSESTVGPVVGAVHAWDLRNLVQGWVDGRRPNHGLALVAGSAAVDENFVSSEHPEPGERPRLTVTHACECGGSPGTLVLQPDAAGFDTYLYDANPGGNFSTSGVFWAADHASGEARPLLRFDLAQLAPQATVESAVLELDLQWVGGGATPAAAVHRVTAPWVESEATWVEAAAGLPWSTPGGDHDATPVSAAVLDPLGPIFWDVTPLVSDWVATPASNMGMLLRPSPGTNFAELGTSDAGPAARPRLTVQYRCPCGVECVLAASGEPSYRDEFGSLTCDPAIDYTQSDGTLDWTPWAWSEVGEDGDSCTEEIRITDDPDVPQAGSYRLRISADGQALERGVDLSPFASPELTLSYRRYSLNGSSQYVAVMVSADGTTWTEAGRISGPATDADYQTASFDLGAVSHISLVGYGMSATKYVYLDDVDIRESAAAVCDDTVLDTFAIASSYSGSDGTRPWATDWLEINEADGPGSGDERVLLDLGEVVLRVVDNDGGGEGVQREADLTGASSATLSFDFRRVDLDGPTDHVTVEVSGDGGTGWTELDRLEGPADDVDYQSASYDISAFIGPDTRIRFVSSPILHLTEPVFFDNVQICLQN